MIGWGFVMACLLVLAWAAAAVAWERTGRWTLPLAGAAVVALWSASAAILARRFLRGIGAVSDLNDGFPWGLWISMDVLSGVALAAGGYVVAAAVHLFRNERFEPVLRPAVLTALLGYLLVAAALLVDIGRPYRIWHPLVMWQPHSIMFEVAWCVTLYTAVLALEFSPVFFERLGLSGPLRAARLVTTPLVLAGVLLSTLHQSSLGSLYLIVPQKLHALWYSPLLPVFFLVSSVAVGMCVIVVESYFSAKVFARSLELDLLADLGGTASVVLWLYLAIKIVDMVARRSWLAALSEPLLGAVFASELLIGTALPAWLLSRARVRGEPRSLLGAALLVIGGVVLNRLSVGWFALIPYAGPVYFPSWMEAALTAAFAAAGIAAFGLAARFLPVFPESGPRSA